MDVLQYTHTEFTIVSLGLDRSEEIQKLVNERAEEFRKELERFYLAVLKGSPVINGVYTSTNGEPRSKKRLSPKTVGIAHLLDYGGS